METKITMFKGKPVIGFYEEGQAKPSLAFGVRKAKIALAKMKEIQAFIQREEAKAIINLQAGQVPPPIVQF